MQMKIQGPIVLVLKILMDLLWYREVIGGLTMADSGSYFTEERLMLTNIIT